MRNKIREEGEKERNEEEQGSGAMIMATQGWEEGRAWPHSGEGWVCFFILFSQFWASTQITPFVIVLEIPHYYKYTVFSIIS